MWFEANDTGCVIGVKRKIHSRADTDFKDAPIGMSHGPLAIGSKLAIPHCEIDQMRNNAVVVKSHRFAGGRSAEFLWEHRHL